MNIVRLPRLTLNELQSVTRETKQICQGVEVLQGQYVIVTNAEVAFIEGMRKDREYGVDRYISNKFRGKWYSCLFRSVKDEAEYPDNSDQCKEVLQLLVNVLDKYGLRIKRLSLDEETAAIDNFIEEFEAVDSTVLVERDLLRWLPLLKAENENFKVVSQMKIQKEAENAAISSATDSAPVLINALEDMYTLVHAHLVIDKESEELNRIYNEILSLLRTYK